MDETTKVITDNINIRLDKVENQNDRQSNDITSIKLDIQKLNNKVDNSEDTVAIASSSDSALIKIGTSHILPSLIVIWALYCFIVNPPCCCWNFLSF